MGEIDEVKEMTESGENQESTGKGKKKGLTKFIGIIIVVAIVVGFKFYKKERFSENIKSQSIEIIQKIPGYDENKTYIDSIFESSFDKAFEGSYDIGGRRRGAKFDENKYITMLFDNLIGKAKLDGKEDLAKKFHVYKILLTTSKEG